MMKSLFFFLLSHFSVGLLFTILFISLRDIGKLFFRVTTLVAASLIILALLAKPFGDLELLSIFSFESIDAGRLTNLFFLTTSLLLVVYNIFQLRIHKALLISSFSFGILGIFFYSITIYESGNTSSLMLPLLFANNVAATLIMGSVLGAMITGHWYLVQHKLSLAPLKNSALIYLLSVLVRIFVIIVSISVSVKSGLGTELIGSLESLNARGYIFIGRIVFGLILPFIFGIMVWKSAQIRSTQSATGILYATIVLVLIGETFAKVLHFVFGVPL